MNAPFSLTADYDAFLRAKMKVAGSDGFSVEPEDINPALAPHCRAIVRWALRGGRRAIFAAFGLHKTSIQIELMRLIGRYLSLVGGNGPRLIVLPLGVRHEFLDEAAIRFTGEHAVALKFIRRNEEIEGDDPIYLANYESVRDGKLDPSLFVAASLDEAAVLRSYGSKTYQEFLPLFARVRFKFVATATPSPNRTKELIHYAGFLGVMDTGQALTRWFQRNSSKANELTLYPHKEDEFWTWVHSWAVFLQRPSDLGPEFSDDGYALPPVTVRWHEVPTDHRAAEPESDGQGVLLKNVAGGIVEAAREKRASFPARISKMQELIAQDPDAHRILWHDLEDERRAICAVVPAARAIFGSQDLDTNEQNAVDFKHGRYQFVATKAEMSGTGCNFQAHCHAAIFVGITYKFHDFIQALHRIVRFGQAQACTIDIIYSEAERAVREVLETKWAEHDAMMARMAEIIRRYGLDHLPVEEVLGRAIGVTRTVKRGKSFLLVNNDAVDETARWPADSVDLLVTSIPFGNHYEYSELYNDFGHTDDNDHFWAQMDFLTPQLLRIMRPGRLACIHVKDRVLFGSVTGAGAPTISPFHAEAIFHYRRHGFDYMGMITVVTDVVRENNGTYRLGYSEMRKDATKMGVGSPEYVILVRKPQSDRARGYADLPVMKDVVDYSLSRWQIDAHAFWRSSGNRLLAPAEFAALMMNLGMDAICAAFQRFSLAEIYDHEYVAALGEALGDRLPKTFMALAPASHDPSVWTDVNRMLTLNSGQASAGREKHICPLQYDIVDRCIQRYSNPGELVFDPFCGLGTVPLRALGLGRRGAGTELHPQYFRDSVHFLKAAEEKLAIPSLFDVVEREEQAA